MISRSLFFPLVLVCFSSTLSANDQIPGAPQSQPILIRNAIIHVIDGLTIDRGSILFDGGKIVAVGQKIASPENALVVQGNGKHVYPGLMDGMTDLGLREIDNVQETVDRTEKGPRNPNVRSWIAVNPDSELIPVARAGGLLLAHVAPSGPFLRGQSAVMQLDGWTYQDMVIHAPAGLVVDWSALEPNDKDAEAEARKRDEKLKELDELLDRAKRYAESRAKNENHIAADLRLEALIPTLEQKVPLIVEANRQSTIESAVAYAAQRSLRLVIYGGYEAEACAGLLKQYNVAVLVAGTYRLPMRRDDPYDAPYTLPERLRKSGVKFAICGEPTGYPGGATNARNLPYHAANAVAYGLPHDVAIESITLSPARILGVDDRVGSLTAGKDATLIVTDGDILETETHVTEAFVQGRQVDLSSKHTMLYEKYKQKYERLKADR